MYTFSIKRDLVPVLEITIDDDMIKENLYFQSLIEKCFEKVFQVITRDTREENSSEEIDPIFSFLFHMK